LKNYKKYYNIKYYLNKKEKMAKEYEEEIDWDNWEYDPNDDGT